jgi:predicted dehydrogenase
MLARRPCQCYVAGMNRRSFLTTTAAAGLSLAAFPHLALAARDRKYRTALIGCGWWGNNILGEAMASGACEIAALCDVDRRMLEATAERARKEAGSSPALFGDFRELLEKTKPEIAIVATPDHWHPLITIAAVKAGAHVYVEKPIAHTILEGIAMVKAARDTGRVVQVGTHRRVSPHNIAARDLIRSGRLGKVGMIRCIVLYGGSGPEQPLHNIEPPKELDWNLWCGPAPLRPFNGGPDLKNVWGGGIHPRGFRQYLDYANGTLGDWGIHWLDQVLWITGEKAPRKVFSHGGRPVKGPPILTATEQGSDAPDHQVATFEFEPFTVQWEHRLFGGSDTEKGENVGCHFYGTKGTLHLGWRDGFTFYPAGKGEPMVHEDARLNEPDQQNIRELWADFLDAIETGRRPVCDIEEGHRATTCSLLGMLSMKLGRSIAWDGAAERIPGDDDASALLRREYRVPWVYPSV